MNNSSVVGVHSTFDDEDLIELIEQDLFPCKDAGAPAVAIGHHTHPNAAAQSTSTPFTNGFFIFLAFTSNTYNIYNQLLF